jgi:hypothetical protein
VERGLGELEPELFGAGHGLTGGRRGALGSELKLVIP